MEQEAADSAVDRAVVEQAAQEAVASEVDMPVAQEEEWAEDREVLCITVLITDRIDTVHVGTDQDLFLFLEDQDITARVVVMALTVKTMAVAWAVRL